MKRRKIFSVLAAASGVVLWLGLLGLYCAYSRDDYRITIAAFVLIAAGLAGLIIFLLLCMLPGKELKRRWLNFFVNYLAYKEEQGENPRISVNYKECLEAIRKNFYSDTDNGKNRVGKVNGYGAKRFRDYSVLQNGKICYGRLIVANDKLFKSSRSVYGTYPAVFIYGFDSCFEEDPAELKKISELIGVEDLSVLLNAQNDYFARFCSEQTDNREIFVSVVTVSRCQLPFGHLCGSLVPLIANPQTGVPVFVVDSKYWTTDFANIHFDNQEEKDSYGEPFDL